MAASIGVDASQQFKAVATYSDNRTQDVTASAFWSSGNPTVATITSGGLATGTDPGAAVITASFGPLTATVSLNVSLTPGLQSISVSPVDSTINPQQSEQFIATGVSSDGSTEILRSIVTWTSSGTLVAEITQGGLATGIQIGSVTITATRGSVSGSATLSVN